MYERFTDRSRKVMQLANQEAQRFYHEYIGTEHILLGLVKEGSGVAANVLKNLDIDLRRIRLEVEKIVQAGPDKVTSSKLPHTPRTKKVIEYALEEASHFSHNYVGTEHLLLGLLREQEGVAAQILMNLGLSLRDVRDEVLSLLGHESNPATSPMRQLREWEREVERLTKELHLARLPEEIRSQVIEIDQEIERLTQEKETAIVEQEFDRAAHLRDRADRLKKRRNALVREASNADSPEPILIDPSAATQRMLACELQMPTHDASGSRLSDTKLAALERRFADRFGTIYHVPAYRWTSTEEGNLVEYEITVWRFLAPDQSETREFLAQLKAEFQAMFVQEVVISCCEARVW